MKKYHTIITIILAIVTITCTSSQGLSTIANNKPSSSSAPTIDIISLIEQVNQTTLLTYLEDLLAFGTRPTTSAACNNASLYISNELTSMGLSVRKQNWTHNTTMYSTNIEATIPGLRPNNPLIFILNTHYDCWPGSPGADDNGAAVAAALTIARILSTHSFNNTIKFVFPSGQEQGLLGTTYYIQEANARHEPIAGVINADFIGYATTTSNGNKIKLYDNSQSRWLTAFTDGTADKYKDYIGLDAIPSGNNANYSDQLKYWAQGFNAIFCREYQFTPNAHTPQDSLENMNVTYATKVCKLLIATLAELGNSDLQIPLLYIDTISGGFGVHTSVMNVGTSTATDINWTIAVTGKTIFIGKISTGVLAQIEPGTSAQIHSRFILGFGAANLTITAGAKTKTGQASVFLCFVYQPLNTTS